MLTRRAKARILWAMAICLAACMLMTMGVLIYSVVSRTVTNEYAVRLQLSLNAALITEGIHVKAEDGYNELDDASYRMLGNYLVRNAVLALHGGDLERPDRVELASAKTPW